MHEMSLCENILQHIQECADRETFTAVTAVDLEVGELVNVELDSMRFGFEVLTRGTLAENSVLNIMTIPGTARCNNCSRVVYIRERFSPCQYCGGFQLNILGGDQLKIKNLEVI